MQNIKTLENSLKTQLLKIPAFIGSTYSIILHTILFGGIYSLLFFGVQLDSVNLILTTIVSLEAIYLTIFLQMTVNQSQDDIEEVQQNLSEIEEDIRDIDTDIALVTQEINEISDDIDEISDDLEDMTPTIGNNKNAVVTITPNPNHELEKQLRRMEKQMALITKQLNTIMEQNQKHHTQI